MTHFKSVFHISKMDCPSEEQMIRMKLEHLNGIRALEFDIPGRQLAVFHQTDAAMILRELETLQLNTRLLETVETAEEAPAPVERQEKKLLWQVLGINFFFFLLEMFSGFFSGSMGLLADSLDMLADSIVYALALFAVGSAATRKKRIARTSGYFQLALALAGLVEVVRRFVGLAEAPVFETMLVVSVLALTGNAACLYLLQKSNSKEAHMQASVIFTSNDVIANLGVILAGVLVYLTQSGIPDLLIGIIVFLLVARGAFRILQLSR